MNAALPAEMPLSSATADLALEPASFVERGFFLRPLVDGDRPWLCDLYASTRADEMALLPWPEPTKRQFVEQQFSLQHRHYLSHYKEASFLAIEHREDGPVGNFYLLPTAPEHLIIHISLLPHVRGSGIGSALIQQCQVDAAAEGCGVRLHVLRSNLRAQVLYERLGFVAEPGEGSHVPMRWMP